MDLLVQRALESASACVCVLKKCSVFHGGRRVHRDVFFSARDFSHADESSNCRVLIQIFSVIFSMMRAKLFCIFKLLVSDRRRGHQKKKKI
jgi:hypothetical protein